ncbi:Uncharacterised protein [Vibrio cholerae]|nr:Uncharacterised protein [Vibrio cholerae]
MDDPRPFSHGHLHRKRYSMALVRLPFDTNHPDGNSQPVRRHSPPAWSVQNLWLPLSCR